MVNFAELASVPSDPLVPVTDQPRLAVAGYLTRFKGSSRYHTESDLRCFLAWIRWRGLDPLARPQLATRPHTQAARCPRRGVLLDLECQLSLFRTGMS